MKTKKIMSTILGLALAFSMFGGIMVSAAGSVSIGIKSDLPNVVEGNNVVISGEILSFPTSVVDGIVAYSVQVTYDAALFTFVSATASADGVLETSDAAGVLTLVYLDSYTGAGTTAHPLTAGDIFSATFTAKTGVTGPGNFVIAGVNGTDDFADNSANYPDWKVPATYTTDTVSVTVDAAVTYTLGDIDGDGYITSADALLAFQHDLEIVALEGTQLLAADVDGDGYVTSADALLIFQYDLEIISNF